MSAIQRYKYVNTIVLGPQDVCNLNYLQAPFNASILADVVSGPVKYNLEFTTDDLTATPPNAQRWNTLPGFTPGATTTQQYTLGFPCTAVRINLTSNDGEIRLSVIQGTGLLSSY